MCMLGNLIDSKEVAANNPIIGYRGWYTKIKDDNNKLYPLNQIKLEPFDKDITRARCADDNNYINDNNHFIKHECGLYSYNNYNNNNNYGHYYNYSYYYYNNYNKNYCNYGYDNYDYNYNYYVVGKIAQHGLIASHELGTRSTYGKPILLVKLTPKNGLDEKFQEFLEHFNKKVDKIAQYYDCEIINHVDFK
jgi:hypothetical protein